MEIIIKCSDECRGNTNLYGEPITEIVRCRDCKWYDNREGCFFSTSEIDPEGFCSFGERRGRS